MAVSQEQKVDFLLKKLGFTKTKTGLAVDSTLSGTKKAGFAEAIPSPLIIANSSVWNEADSIPATPPGSDTNQVRVYLAATSGHRMTVDSTVANNRAFIAFSTYNNTSSARLNNWIDTQFGAGYLIKVFRGDPNGGGVQLSAAGSGNNDGWFFDYSAGVLNFNDTNVPSGVSGTNIYVVGYRYIGQTGAPTSGISTFSFLDLSVERNLDVGSQGGISTFRNNIDLNADLDVDGHTNLDNLSVAGVSTFASNADFSSGIDVTGNITGTNNLILSGNVNATAITANGNINCNGSQLTFSNNSGGKIRFLDTNNNPDYNIESNQGLFQIYQSPGDPIIKINTDKHVDINYNLDLAAGLDVIGTTNLRNTNIDRDLDVDGHTNLDNVSIAGVTTITQDLDVDGHTNLDNVSIAGITTFTNSAGVGDFKPIQLEKSGTTGATRIQFLESGTNKGGITYSHDNNRIEIQAESSGKIRFNDVSNAQFALLDGTGLTVNGASGITALAADINGDLDVDGHTNLDNVNISGMTTMSGNLQVGRITASDYIRTSSQLQIFSTNPTIVLADTDSENDFNIKNNNGVFTVQDSDSSIDRFKITSSGQATITGDLDVTRHLDVDGHTDLDNVSIAGVTTFTGNAIVDGVLTVKSGNETQDRLQVGDSGQLRIYHAGHNYYRSHNATSNHIFTVNGSQVVMSLGSNGTANLFYQGSKKLSTTNTGIDVTGDANFSGNVSIGGTLTYEDVKNIDSVGIITARDGIRVTGGVIEALAGENKIPALYSAMSNLPSAGTYHGMFAHVHATGRGYFAHAGNWMELVNKEINGVVGTGTETYSIGNLVSTSSTTTSLNVTGVSTFASSIEVADSIKHNGDPNTQIDFANDRFTFKTNNVTRVDIQNGNNFFQGSNHFQADSTYPKSGQYVARFRDTTGDDTVVHFHNTNVKNTVFRWNDYGSSSTAGNFVFTNLTGTEYARFTGSGNFNILKDLDVDGHTNLDNVSVAGVTTFSDTIRVGSGVTIEPNGQTYSTGISTTTENFYIKPDTQQNRGIYIGSNEQLRLQYTGGANQSYLRSSASFLSIASNIVNIQRYDTNFTLASFTTTHCSLNYAYVKKIETTSSGINVIGVTTTTGLAVTGVSTFTGAIDANGDLDVDGHTNLDNVSIAGVSTFSNTVHIGTGTTIESNGQATFTGITTFHNFIRLPNYNPGTTVGKIQIGELQGYEIFHYNNNNYLTFTRNLYIRGDASGRTIHIQPKISQNGIEVIPDGAIELYYSGSKQWETTSLGTLSTGSHHYLNNNNASIFFGGSSGNYGVNAGIGIAQQGNYHISGSGAGDLCVSAKTGENILFGARSSGSGATYKAAKIHANHTFEINGDLQLPNDTKKIQLGTSQDLQLYHDGSNSLLTNSTGTLLIRADNLDLRPNTNSSEVYLRCTQNAGVELRYDSVKKFETTSTGVNITGIVTATSADINGDLDVDGHTNLDNVSIAGVTTVANDTEFIFGTNATATRPLKIKHQSSNTRNQFTANYIDFNVTDARFKKIGTSDQIAQFFTTGVNLFYNGTQRFSTAPAGAKVYGNLQIQSNQPNLLFIDENADNDFSIKCDGGSLQFVDSTDSYTTRMSINSSGNVSIVRDLDVDGHTNLDNVSIAGVTTFAGTAQFNSTIGVHDGTTGGSGQYLRATGTGVTWASFPSMRTSQSFTASAGQTTFTFTYNVGFLDVFVNGVKLSSGEFTANNGSSVVLSVGSFVGDIVELVSYFTTSYAAGDAEFTELVQDTSPQLGGNLDLFNKSITGTGNINMTGVVTATSFVGDGSGLTGVIASGTGIIIKNSGSTVGTAGTINFGDNLSVSALSGGAVTISAGAANTSDVRTNTLSVIGVSTFTGAIDANGDLDVDGHTNLDNVSVAGVTTFASNVNLGDSDKIILGDGSDLQLFHDGTNSHLSNSTGELRLGQGGTNVGLYYGNVKCFHTHGDNGGSVGMFRNLTAGDDTQIMLGASGDYRFFHEGSSSKNVITCSTAGLEVRKNNTTEVSAKFIADGAAELYFDNTKRFETTNQGINVTGHSELDNVNIAGVVTATTFKGAIEATSGTFSSNVTIDAGTNTTLTVEADSAGVALFKATGGSGAQATAALELIQSTTSQQGGGISYNGDGSPAYASGETADHVTFFRMQNGSRTEVFSYPYNSNNVVFNGTVTASSFSGSLGANNLTGTITGSVQSNITQLGTLGSLTVSGTNNPVNFTHTGQNCVTFNRNSKQLAINANYGGSDQYANIAMTSGMDIRWTLGGADRIVFKSAGHIEPQTDSQINLGSTTKRFANVYADNFVGDGSGLTGITASGSGVVIKHDGSTVGTAGTINFSTNLDVSAISGGAVTITASGGGGSGISTISGVVNIANDLDVDGHTNLDNISVAGVSTFSGTTTINTSGNEKLILSGSSNPYIQFQEGTTNKAYLQWSSGSGHIQLGNEANSTVLRIISGETGLVYRVGTNNRTVWTSGNDGASSGLDADLLDGQEGSYYSPNVGITTNLSGTFTASAGSPSTINTFGYGSGDIVVEYTVFIKNGSDFQSQKLLAMRDGTTIHSTQFAVMYSSSLLVQLDATISSGNILLRATPETGVSGSTTYKIKREVM